MAVKLRLSRLGKKHVPFYRVVAIDESKKRDGAYLEDLGTYNGLKKTIVHLLPERIEYWISVGAQPTGAVKKIQKLYKQSVGSAAGTAQPAKAVKAKPKKAAAQQAAE